MFSPYHGKYLIHRHYRRSDNLDFPDESKRHGGQDAHHSKVVRFEKFFRHLHFL